MILLNLLIIQQRQHDIDRENVEIERLQRQYPNQPLPIDVIFDINVDNIDNDNHNNLDNDQNDVDDYWRRRNLRYQEQLQAIEALNAQLQPNQEIPFEVIDDQNPDVDENNNYIY